MYSSTNLITPRRYDFTFSVHFNLQFLVLHTSYVLPTSFTERFMMLELLAVVCLDSLILG